MKDFSVDDKKFSARNCRGTVRFSIVCNLVAHACRQNEFSTIFKLSVKFAFGA